MRQTIAYLVAAVVLVEAPRAEGPDVDMRRLPADQLCHSLSGLGGACHADMSVAERIHDVRSAAGGGDHPQRIRHTRSMAPPPRGVLGREFIAQRGEHAARMSEQDASTLPIGRRVEPG